MQCDVCATITWLHFGVNTAWMNMMLGQFTIHHGVKLMKMKKKMQLVIISNIMIQLPTNLQLTFSLFPSLVHLYETSIWHENKEESSTLLHQGLPSVCVFYFTPNTL